MFKHNNIYTVIFLYISVPSFLENFKTKINNSVKYLPVFSSFTAIFTENICNGTHSSGTTSVIFPIVDNIYLFVGVYSGPFSIAIFV